MVKEEEYVQLSSWEELKALIERAQLELFGKDWNPKPKRRDKKKPPQSEGLF
jgi:hypothetical protein